MNHPTLLSQALSLLLLSLSLGLAQPALAEDKKQAPSLQCEQEGVLGPCPGSTTVSGKTGKTGKPVSFKAQSDEAATDKPVKKKKGKKTGGKKAKRNKTAEE